MNFDIGLSERLYVTLYFVSSCDKLNLSTYMPSLQINLWKNAYSDLITNKKIQELADGKVKLVE